MVVRPERGKGKIGETDRARVQRGRAPQERGAEKSKTKQSVNYFSTITKWAVSIGLPITPA